MATVTDLVAGTGVGGVQEAAGANYALEEHTVDNQKGGTIYVSRYYKKLAGESGTSGIVFEATGVSSVDQATARATALTSLNAMRRHRYAGAPGKPSGATTGAFPDGLATNPTVDVT